MGVFVILINNPGKANSSGYNEYYLREVLK